MLWLKAGHIIALAAWMAALWYLPRIMVYHVGAQVGSDLSETFKLMERRLLRFIATPAMLVTLVTGLLLATVGSWWHSGWLHAKLALVVAMTAVQGILAREVRRLGGDQRLHGGRYYRLLNEVPTLLFIGIVILVVVQPF
jgi:protoporphyrinogen IX oxidase